MSHFTKLSKAKITSVEAFILACAELGFTSVRHDVEIKDMVGASMRVAVAVKAGKWDIALVENGSGKFDMVADWYGVRWAMDEETRKRTRSVSDEGLQDALLRLTTKYAIIQRYKKQGFRAVIGEDAENNITVKLTRAS